MYTIKKIYDTILCPPAATFTPDKYPDLLDTVSLVTGASNGLGWVVTKELLKKNGHVIAAVRNADKMQLLFEAENITTGKLDIVTVDLSDLDTIKGVVPQIEKVTDTLDIIVHNAGTSATVPPTTKQGFNNIIGTNNFGPFLLQKYLDPLFLKQSKSAYKRLLWISSGMQLSSPSNGGIDFKAYSGEAAVSDANAYIQSKVAMLYYAKLWSVHHEAAIKANDKIVSLSVHPGFLSTELGKGGSYFNYKFQQMGHKRELGGLTVLFALLYPDIDSASEQGLYVVPWGRKDAPRPDIVEAYTNGFAQKIWDFTEEKVAQY